ncbi:MAG: succinate dehydrogenase/fumarate reductase iron-sulfur subunit, partial [Candidatus Electrothrix sp. EH2]|nr:succinate dehydrogenase/fumarate reductase iron-sulfur subunit [Candidatus Electrothrix sp. EH2]
GPEQGTTLCQLHVRHFQDGQVICIEPFRSRAFPVIKDLMVDRSAFDRIMQAGGFVSINTGSAPDADAVPIVQKQAEQAMDAAACIGCGACVAACPNAAAMLFTAAKISQLALLPQGGAERKRRALSMVEAMDKEGFGNCSNHRECEQVCPKGISIRHIARMNREYLAASLFAE